MQQRETLLNHSAVHAQPRIVLLTAGGDDLPDPDCSNLVAVLVVVVATVGIELVVVATVGIERVRTTSRAATATAPAG
jgi:hypothetical protein